MSAPTTDRPAINRHSEVTRVRSQMKAIVTDLAAREGRPFVEQLDRLVDAGLRAQGHPGLPAPDAPDTTT